MRCEVPLFRFKPFTMLRYAESSVDKTTFIIGERREDDKKCLIKIMKYMNDDHVIEIVRGGGGGGDPTDTMIMEYIDTFEDYLIGAEQHRNALWSKTDEEYYKTIYTDAMKPPLGTHPNVFPIN